jgi:hypothetical protein
LHCVSRVQKGVRHQQQSQVKREGAEGDVQSAEAVDTSA